VLILGRREQERIVISINGSEVWLTIVETSNSKVRIGFTADPGVLIDREEIHLKRNHVPKVCVSP